MAPTGRGDSTRVAEGLIPMVATTADRRRVAGRIAIANGMGLSRDVGIVHGLRASALLAVPEATRESGSPAARPRVEREIVRFIAIEATQRPERKPSRAQSSIALGEILTSGLESPGPRCT